jgi:16S rRNA (uracil1498-N3)-methyltransferase
MHQYYFYVNPDYIVSDLALLKNDELRHCIQVLRHKIGDRIWLFNGQGVIYSAEIRQIDKNSAECRILAAQPLKNPFTTEISVAFGLLKSKALDLLIRELTSLGVRHFIPLITRHSVKHNFNLDRMQKIVLEALKQSGNLFLTSIQPLVDISQWLKNLLPNQVKLIADQANAISIKKALMNCSDVSRVVILIGPEGGFHPEEVALAIDNNFIPVAIHPYRLRSELAAITAVNQIIAYC